MGSRQEPVKCNLVVVRPLRPDEAAAAAAVQQQAFAGRHNEALLVTLLHDAGRAVVSLVATCDGLLVGHVVFSEVELDPPSAGFSAVALGPVGVLPACQRQGVGSRLIRQGLAACGAAGYGCVAVLGAPAYYGRFGFRRAADHGFANAYGAVEEFMLLELRPGAAAGQAGKIRYAPEFQASGC